MTLAVSCRTTAGAALAGLVAFLALGCATGETPGRPAATGAEARPPAPSPALLTVTPARFDAYLLAMRNIRAAHPNFLAMGADEAAVREEMREAVERAGLRLEDFRDIHRQVQADPVLRAEAESRLAGAAAAAEPAPAPRP